MEMCPKNFDFGFVVQQVNYLNGIDGNLSEKSLDFVFKNQNHTEPRTTQHWNSLFTLSESFLISIFGK